MSNYEVVKGPTPASYAGNPNFGLQLGQMLSQLPNSYMEGRQFGQQRELEDMFRNKPIPRNKDGSVNVDELIDTGAKTGGFPFVMKMLPYLQNDALLKKAGERQGPTLGVGDDAPRTGGPPFAPMTGGQPPTTTPPRGGGSAAVSPDTADNKGDQTLLANVASETFGGDRDMSANIAAVAKQMGIDPSQPLTEGQQARAKVLLQRSAADTMRTAAIDRTQPGDQNGAAASPSPAGGTSGAPGPVAGGPATPTNAPPDQPTTTPAQAQLGQQPDATGASPQQPLRRPGTSFTIGGPQGQGPEGQQVTGTGLPPGYTLENAQRYENEARRRSDFGLAASRIPGNDAVAKKFQDESAQLAATAKMIREAVAKNAEISPEGRKARESGIPGGPLGMETATETRKKDIDISKTKTEPKIRAMADIAHESQPQIDIMRRTVADPNFYSGAGDELMKKFNQWTVALGGKPDQAQPMETFHKNAMRVLNDQIGAMTAAGYSRIQLQEIKNLKESIANLKITPASNRYLIEELSRVHDQNLKLSKLAQDHIEKNGYLGPSWERVKDAFFEDPKNKLFSKQELDDPRLISPPYLPRSIAADPAKKAQWERNQKIEPGDPIMVDGPDPRKPPGPDNVRHLRAW